MKGWKTLLLLVAGSFIAQNVVNANDVKGNKTYNSRFSPVKYRVRATQPVVNNSLKYEKTEIQLQNRKPGQTVAISPYIIKGRASKLGEIPYQVAIYMDEEHFCGGSLISNLHVLTAAHCVEPYSSFTMHFGAYNREGTDEGVITMSSKFATHHPSYSPSTLKHDIGIITLPEEITFSDTIKKVELASPALTKKLVFKGASMIVAGWGKLADAEETIGDLLKTATLKVLSNNICLSQYTEEIFKGSRHICVIGNKGDATCQGDSGGPVTIKNDDVFYQVGIVSYGSTNGCENNDPEVLLKVASYRHWINKKTGIQF